MKTRQELANDIADLGSRLFYCSDSVEGRKVRKEIERCIRELKKRLRELEKDRDSLVDREM